MTALAVAVSGVPGRMGRVLVAAVAAADDLRLGAALGRPDSPRIGADAGELAGIGALRVPVGDDIESVAERFDVLVDFSTPAATLRNLETCAARRKPAVIGTTGFDAAGVAAIERAARATPVVVAPNTSLGVNVVFKLAAAAARAFGDDVDVEVFEAHHRHKVDAPSGTALRLGEILAAALGRDLARDAVYGREGVTGVRDRRAIGFHSVRAGDIVGEHTVTFAGAGERVEITHRAGSRESFASGAMRAARFVAAKRAAGECGLFGMDAVLGLAAVPADGARAE